MKIGVSSDGMLFSGLGPAQLAFSQKEHQREGTWSINKFQFPIERGANISSGRS